MLICCHVITKVPMDQATNKCKFIFNKTFIQIEQLCKQDKTVLSFTDYKIYPAFLPYGGVSQLSTHHTGISVVPKVITDGPPSAIHTYLHTTVKQTTSILILYKSNKLHYIFNVYTVAWLAFASLARVLRSSRHCH